MKKSERIEIFCTELKQWFLRNKRTLPWRDLTVKNLDHKAYRILVSEVMLQQTQVSRVIILYKNFIQKFPRIEDLSSATNREILIAWRGLGYNNRALRLRDAAREIVQSGGVFPTTMEELQKLPGIGHYTAGAIRNFAFDIPTPCIDVNIRRILHRFFVGIENLDGTWKKTEREILRLAEEILKVALSESSVRTVPSLPALPTLPSVLFSPSSYHAALMDFGSLVCTKNSPKWERMSRRMQTVCRSYGKDIVRTKKMNKREPGRMVAGRFVPNRIFRGKIVEVLRDARRGLTLDTLGAAAIPDWSMEDQRKWLDALLKGLVRDAIAEVRDGTYMLRE